MLFSLDTALLAACVGAGVLTAAFAYLSLVGPHHRVHAWWAGAFACDAVRYVLLLVAPEDLAPAGAATSQVLQIGRSILLLAGVLSLTGRRGQRAWLLGGALAAVGVVLAAGRMPFFWQVLPGALLAGAALVTAGMTLWRSGTGAAGPERRLIAVVLVLWGVHVWDYPWLRPVPWFAPIGFMLAQAFALAIALLFIIHTLRQQFQAADIALERARDSDGRVLASEARYEQFVDHAPVPILVHRQGRLLYANPAAAALLGYPDPDALLHAAPTLEALVEPDWHEPLRERLRMPHARASGRQQWSFVARRRDGGTLHLESGEGLLPWHGQAAVLAVLTDVTTHRDALAALQASEQRYRNLIEGSLQGIAIIRERRLLFVNQAYAQMFGYDDPQTLMAETTVEALNAPHERERLSGYERARLSGGQAPAYFEFEGLRRDGAHIWLAAFAMVVEWDGAPAVQMTTYEITERRRAEQELRTSQRLLQTVFDTIPHPLFVRDTRGRYVMVNRTLMEQFGRSEEAIRGRTNAELFGATPEQFAETMANDEAVLAGEALVHQVETSGDSRFGRRHLQVIKAPLRGEDGSVQGLVGLGIDITDRVEAEEALRASEQRFRQFTDTVSDWVWELDEHLTYRYVTGNTASVFGIEPEAMLGRHPWDIHAQTATPEALAEYRRRAETHEPLRDLVLQGRYAAGHQRLVQLNALPLFDAEGTFSGYRGTGRDVTEQRAAQEEAERAQALLTDAIESLPAAVMLFDREERLVRWNGRVAEVFPGLAEVMGFGMSYEDLLTRYTAHQVDVAPDLLPAWLDDRRKGFRNPPATEIVRLRDGRWMEMHDHRTSDGGTLSLRFDATEMKRREQELLQAQKMEAVGQLTGGVAHDFNNLLQIMLGYTMLALQEAEEGRPSPEDLRNVQSAAERAASLTRQLLAFSRRQALQAETLSVNATLQGLATMLERALGPDIELIVRPDAAADAVHADRGMLEQVVLNLAINARDAMPDGGSITLETAEAVLDQAFCMANPWAQPGRWVHIACRDTGKGMPPEVQARIFEPFFTTKGPSKGTGLGLSTVYGIVQQHGGLLHVESEPGEGTTFHLYLPATGGQTIAAAEPPAEAVHPPGTHTILVAEDTTEVRELLVNVLQAEGYHVLAAEDGDAAEATFRAHAEAIDLAVLDVTMPGQDGWGVYASISALRPELPVLFSSAVESLDSSPLLDGQVRVLRKPYTPDGLRTAVREMLALPPETDAGAP